MDEPRDKSLTLSERVEAVFGVLEERFRSEIKTLGTFKVNKDSFLSARRYCLICGLLRMDQDATGMTCGSERCLRELETRFKELGEDSEFLHDLAEMAGLLREDGSIDEPELEGKFEDNKTMADTLKEVAKKLGLNPGQNIDSLCAEIKLEVENLRFKIESIEKKQK